MNTAGRIYVILYRVAASAIVAAAVLIVLPMLFGVFPYAVRTGSMEPAIRTGSLCFVDRRTSLEELREGDVIAFRVGEMVVTHRAVRIDASGVTTRGDANNVEDAAKVTDESLVGRAVFWVPWAGKPLLYLQTLRGKLAAGAAVLLFLLAGVYYDRLMRERPKENPEAFPP